MGGTSLVVKCSNSHKTKSLQELLEYDFVHEYYLLPSDKEIEQMIERAKFLLREGNGIRKKIQTRSKKLSDSAKKMIEVLRG